MTEIFAKKNENQSDDKKYISMITYRYKTRHGRVMVSVRGRAGRGGVERAGGAGWAGAN